MVPEARARPCGNYGASGHAPGIGLRSGGYDEGRFLQHLRAAVRQAKRLLVLALAGVGVLAMPRQVRAQATQTAQTEDTKAVVAVVERFFQGMLQRDTALMRSTVDPSARLMASTTRDGHTTISALPMDRFIASTASRQGEGANEQIHAPEVHVDGDLAQVWTFYTLHVGERFIHCGTDAFQLMRTETGWKIVNVADTRRTTNCEVPGKQ